jgi:hypothetical protein
MLPLPDSDGRGVDESELDEPLRKTDDVTASDDVIAQRRNSLVKIFRQKYFLLKFRKKINRGGDRLSQNVLRPFLG